MVVFLDKTIGVVGAGSIGEEVISALYEKGHRNIIATRRDSDALQRLSKIYKGITTTSDNLHAVRNAEVLVLAVKPKSINDVLQEMTLLLDKKLVLSLAAAKPIASLEQAANNKSMRIGRVMTGIYVAEQTAMYAMSESCTCEDREIVKYIFGKCAMEREEALLAHRTWIACATGLLPNAIEEEIAELEKLGMSSEDARQIYARDLEAIAKRFREGLTGKQILNAVGAPGSFTRGLTEHLERERYYSLLRECVTKTVNACSEK
ncbi:hypothetical protein COV18_05745 [Candidatus Woesearchaeota archaeon CG10_big_fil_rev_8_21_14_0_10_37_12]|nr:MAG: hypothetical protein COV18_05745 [Candidatus Woesearchaeota archaeon CG10_big_fil_rev_8_21_14_0_10_37_12]